MSDSQWNIKVKIEKLDRGDVVVKNMWQEGSTVTVQIEPHATINMMKQRIAILVAAHMKHQTITNVAGEVLDDIKKLQDVMADGATVLLHVVQPKEEEAPPVELSDDEGLIGEEEADCEPLPSKEDMAKELTDEEVDKQNGLKGEGAELLEDGDKSGALAKLTAAIAIGAPSAMMISKRAELLLKLRRPKAAASDATAALEINPDSGKAYKVRGKARRLLGDYEGAKADLDQAQKIDYDDGVADVHDYVTKRVAKLTLKAQQDARKAAQGAAEGT
jgi:suppressor of tumorigenicity protein 13